MKRGTAADTSEKPSNPIPRHTRRLSDKILLAFHHACDYEDLEVAQQLLHVVGMILARKPVNPDGDRRKNKESLVAAHERLWHLQNPNAVTE
jgi:hypothetical protein